MASDEKSTPPDVASILGVVDTYLRWERQATMGHRSYKHYHPSEWGKCLRRQQLKHYYDLGIDKVKPVEVDLPSDKIRLFHKGDNMHLRWQQWYFTKIGIARGVWSCPNCNAFYGKDEKIGIFMPEKCENCDFVAEEHKSYFNYHEIKVRSEELNFEGHADMILDFSRFDPSKYKNVRHSFNAKNLPKKPIVVDMKSAAENAFKFQLPNGAHSYYIIQITIYAHLLDVPYGIILYENKNDSSMRAFKCPQNPEIFDTVKWQAQKMQKMVKKQQLPPPRPLRKDSFECKNCEFSKMCHSHKVWKAPDLDERRKYFYRNLL